MADEKVNSGAEEVNSTDSKIIEKAFEAPVRGRCPKAGNG